MKATQKQRNVAREFLTQIQKEAQELEEGIEDAVLDDWNDYGSFQIILVLKADDTLGKGFDIKTNLQRLTPLVKRAARETRGVYLSEINQPELVTEWNKVAQRSEVKGHRTTTTMVDFSVPSSVSQDEHDDFFQEQG